MLDDAERGDGLAADALGRRIGRDELRVALFDFPQLPHEGVVFGVADFGAVEDVVAIVVVGDEGAKLFGAELCGLEFAVFLHGDPSSMAEVADRASIAWVRRLVVGVFVGVSRGPSESEAIAMAGRRRCLVQR